DMMEYNHTINREHRDNLPNENNAEGLYKLLLVAILIK
ncbi:unnamed protein product, partial [Rotaria magnacalcarata]